MAILKVARLGHPVLLRVADSVPRDALATPAMQQLIDDLLETMRDERGVGLAAPQVHRSLRLFVMDPGPSREPEEQGGGLRVLVNPELTFPEEDRIGLWEGCLSIPGLRGETERFARVDVAYLDRDGRTVRATFEGFPAAVVQHENDHLDGILFLQRMPDLTRLAFEDQMGRLRPDDEPEAEGDEEDDDDARAEPGIPARGERKTEDEPAPAKPRTPRRPARKAPARRSG